MTRDVERVWSEASEEAGYDRIYGRIFLPNAAVAEKKSIYDGLVNINLNQKLDWADQEFGAVISCGAFTSSHIQISAFKELVRITRKGGHICITARDSTGMRTLHGASSGHANRQAD